LVDYFTESQDQIFKLADAIQAVIPCLAREMFTLKQNYTVALKVTNPYGKWPEQLGNSFFTDS
jgi:hypothetical protein